MPKFTPKTQVTLKDYFLIIFSRKRFFLLPFMIVFFTASIGSFFLPKYYRSSVLVKVEEKRPINPLVAEERFVAPRREITLTERMRTLTEEILSYDRLYPLIIKLNLYEGVVGDLAAFESLIKNLRKRITIKMKSPDLFAVYYEDKDPQRAKEVLNTLVDIFIEDNKERKKEEAMVGVDYAESQAWLYREKLNEAERKLREFREKHALELPGKELDMNVQMLVNFQTELVRVRMDLNDINKQAKKVNRQLSGKEPVIISEDMLDLNPIVIELNIELQKLQFELDTLLMEDPESEQVYKIQQAIEETRGRLQEEIEKSVDAETIVSDPLFYQRLKQRLKDAQNTQDNLKNREKELKTLVEIYEGRMKSLPGQEAEYSRLSRDVEVNDQIYKMLKLKAEESRLTAVELEKRGINYELFEKEGARISFKPSKPQKLLIAAISLLLGFISGIGCVFLAEFADRSFKNTEDIISYLTLPCLGSVSKIMTEKELAKRKRNQRSIIILLIVLTLTLIIAGGISTYISEKKASMIIAEQEELQEKPKE